MREDYNNLYLFIIIIYLLHFLWYYLTLPGSVLSINKNQEKPKLRSAFLSYLTYLLPTMFLIYYLNSKDKNCSALKAYINLTCNK